MSIPSSGRPAEAPLPATARSLASVEEAVGGVLRGRSEVVRMALVGVLARGHVLIEDVPGVGKTLLARALATALGLDLRRIQFTSDLLPGDILGMAVLDGQGGGLRFAPGPIFANLVLADEINRASPRTQSALLEAMSEAAVTIDGERWPLPDPFLVIATQNPLDHVGTYPLPESQLDRFLLTLEIGYPDAAAEREILRSGGGEPALASLRPQLESGELAALQEAVGTIHVADKLTDYLLELTRSTRRSTAFRIGISTRGVQAWLRAAQACALLAGRDFVVPDDIQDVAPWVLAHRLLPRDGDLSRSRSRMLLAEILERVPVPV